MDISQQIQDRVKLVKLSSTTMKDVEAAQAIAAANPDIFDCFDHDYAVQVCKEIHQD